EIAERLKSERLFRERRVHPLHLRLDRGVVQPVGVVLLKADAEGTLQQARRRSLGVGWFGFVVGLFGPGATRLLLRRLQYGHARQRVIGDELVARGGERPADRTGDADADDVAAESFAALRERNV